MSEAADPVPEPAFGAERVTLQIKMNRSYADFKDTQKAAYLADLALVAGCSVADFSHHVYIKACVKHECDLPLVVAARLLAHMALLEKEAETQASKDGDPESLLLAQALRDLREFVAEHGVESIRPYETLRIQVLEAEPQPAAVFVHGWRGDQDSFGQMPQWLEEATGWRSAVYSYPTGLWGRSPSISFVAAALDNWIQARFAGVRLAVVGHSMGGVVLRKVLCEQHMREHPLKVQLAVMCASPHTGTLASQVRKIPTLDSAQLRELDPDSPFLFDLNCSWTWWVTKHQAGRVAVRSVVAQGDGIVSIASASGLDPAPLVVLGADHRDLVKPADPQAPIMESLVSWVRSLH